MRAEYRDDFRVALKEVMDKAKELHNLTNEKIALRAGIPRSTLQSWMLGKSTPADNLHNFEALQAIEELADAPIGFLAKYLEIKKTTKPKQELKLQLKAACDSMQFCFTKKGIDTMLWKVQGKYKPGQPIWLKWRRACPVGWIENGWVEER